MIRLSKLADYGVVLMTHFAASHEPLHSTASAAAVTGVPEPTAGKILKLLARGGLLVSRRGSGGGYAMTGEPGDVSIADIVAAVDGPISLTECLDAPGGGCDLEPSCPARGNWRKINDAVRHALEGVTLADMAEPLPEAFIRRVAEVGRRHGKQL